MGINSCNMLGKEGLQGKRDQPLQDAESESQEGR